MQEKHLFIECVNDLKHDGRLCYNPHFILDINGSQYGSDISDLFQIDYRMYREYGWDWDKRESIKFKIINNFTGKIYNMEYRHGEIVDVKNDFWETHPLGKELYGCYMKFTSIKEKKFHNKSGYYMNGSDEKRKDTSDIMRKMHKKSVIIQN